ncbi:ABC transporter substrate-binding protein [Janibacter limosus]|jgi:iron complex transport system substrate-binding protein|uniref:ABC transporter substrate-binding protein n=1 Tax=Janibacter limosus TaxID=53458 RepID=UPI000837A105|nr:ABC transporter substrate-binding protein [Janibacter limosus]
MTPLRPVRAGAALLVAGLLAACGTGSDARSTSASTQVTVTNCGAEVAFPAPAQRMYVGGDGNLLAMVLALGAQDQVAGVVGLDDTKPVLSSVYGADVVDGLTEATPDHPTMENVIAQRPDVVLAGWSYGYSEEKKLTPDLLADRDIGGYVLSESCRQADGRRGTMPPWEALRADIHNLGAITGRVDAAAQVNADIDRRRTALDDAPQAADAPTVFLFDSGTQQIFTSGAYGGPQAIIETAGGRNATEDVKDTWTEVSWEQLVSSEPDAFAFVDYDGQSFEDKVKVLKSNPATKDLPAVLEERFVNLPISAWTSSPLNIDAAEQLRATLEEHDLVPESGIEPQHDLQP